MRWVGFILVSSLTFSAFGDDDRLVSQAKSAIKEINGYAKGGLDQASFSKYKMAALCKFIGQLIDVSEKAEKLSFALSKDRSTQDLASQLMKLRALIFVSEVDICTASHDIGKSDEENLSKEGQDTDTLTAAFNQLAEFSK